MRKKIKMPFATVDFIDNQIQISLRVVCEEPNIYSCKVVDNNGVSDKNTIISSSNYTGKIVIYGNLSKVKQLILWGDAVTVNGQRLYYGAQITPQTVKQFPNLFECVIRSVHYTAVNNTDNKFGTSGDFSDIHDTLERLNIFYAPCYYGKGIFNMDNLSETSRLSYLNIFNGMPVSGDIIKLPATLTFLSLEAGNFSGNLSTLKSKNIIQTLILISTSTITCSAGVEFPECITFTIQGNNTLAYLPSYLPKCKKILVQGYNTIASLPDSPLLEELNIQGNNTIASITSYPKLTYISVGGNNTISVLPTIANFTKINTIYILGYNTINIIPNYPNLVTCVIQGLNTISSIPTLPELVQVEIRGNNTISTIGNYLKLKILQIYGNNVISTLGSLPSLTNIIIDGQNVISGQLPDYPNLTYFDIRGLNTVSGISYMPKLILFKLDGYNTVTGDIFSKLPIATTIMISGNNSIVYTSKVWVNSMNIVNIYPSSSFTSAMVDQMIIDLANVTNWVGNKGITIKGASGTRTSVSDVAYNILRSKGVGIVTN